MPTINPDVLKMIKIVFLIIATLSSAAFAMPSDENFISNEKISPSKVERVITLQSETDKRPSVRLVLVDAGGSTDISSRMVPSRLFLTIHKDGEMFNVEGNYELVGVVSVTKAKLEGCLLNIEVTSRDKHLKIKKTSYSVKLGEALSEVETAKSEQGVDYSLKSNVGVSRGK